MRRIALIAALSTALLISRAPSSHGLQFAEKLDMRSWGTRIRKPAGAEIEYVPEKQTYFLGEPIYVLARVKNNGDNPISFRHGSDYRGTPRALRFVLRAVAAQGKPVPDPHPKPNCMGGRGGLKTIKPGEMYEQKLLLQTWCEIDMPGAYTVTAGQDIGWDEPVKELSTREWSRSPGGSFKITLVAPSEEDAQRVLDAMVRKVGTTDNVWRAKQPFAYIRHPAYLKPLRALTSDGKREVREAAIDGIGSILTEEATLALIDVLDHPDPTTALIAAETLNWRMPHPDPYRSAAKRSPFMYERNEEKRKEAVSLAWRDEFTGRVVAHARKMLRSDEKKHILAGVFVIWCFKDAESMDIFLSAIDGYVQQEQAKDPQWPTYGYEFMSGAQWAKTARALIDAGAARPRVGEIDTVGKALVWLNLVSQDDDYRPREWQAEYMRCLRHPNSLARLVAVSQVPRELVGKATAQLIVLANDSHESVRRTTWAVARRLKIKAFLPIVLERLRRETTKMALDSACSFCAALGDDSHIDILIERLVEPSVALPVHLILYEKTTNAGCGFRTDSAWTVAEREKLQSEWREWFNVNRKALKKLGRLRPDDDRLGLRPTPRDFTTN